jgi:hypothetical protein
MFWGGAVLFFETGKIGRDLLHVHRPVQPQRPHERLTAQCELEACGPRMQMCTTPRQADSRIDAQDGCGAWFPDCRLGTDDHAHQV